MTFQRRASRAASPSHETQRVVEIGKDLGDRFILLRFEEFCDSALASMRELAAFAALQVDESALRAAAACIHRPASVRRGRALPLDVFDERLLREVKSWEYELS